MISRQPAMILQVSLPTATEPILRFWLCRATLCMGRRTMAALRAMAQYLESTPAGRGLWSCIRSLHSLSLIIMAATTTELTQTGWLYQAVLCMGRRLLGALLALARYSP